MWLRLDSEVSGLLSANDSRKSNQFITKEIQFQRTLMKKMRRFSRGIHTNKRLWPYFSSWNITLWVTLCEIFSACQIFTSVHNNNETVKVIIWKCMWMSQFQLVLKRQEAWLEISTIIQCEYICELVWVHESLTFAVCIDMSDESSRHLTTQAKLDVY